jgi:hypothetical protein
MGDKVPSFGRGTLKRTRSTTFSPVVGEFYADDTAPSIMSVSAFGAFANDDASDFVPSAGGVNDYAPSTGAIYDHDEAYSNGVGGSLHSMRGPIDDVNPYWDGELIRTRSWDHLKDKIKDDGLASFTPALTPRTPRFVDLGGQTPRCRDDLTDIDDVKLELVGTTLVAKSSNESVKLAVSFAHRCVVCASISLVLFS